MKINEKLQRAQELLNHLQQGVEQSIGRCQGGAMPADLHRFQLLCNAITDIANCVEHIAGFLNQDDEEID